MTTNSEYLKKLSPERQAKINARAKQLIAEESKRIALRKSVDTKKSHKKADRKTDD